MDDGKLEKPVIEDGAWVAPGAVLVGRVIVRRGASVWYGCVLRSDMAGAEIEIGQDATWPSWPSAAFGPPSSPTSPTSTRPA